jgi:tetratricopeptide (TPR) repeat protein
MSVRRSIARHRGRALRGHAIVGLTIALTATGCSGFGGGNRTADAGPDLASVVAGLPEAPANAAPVAPPDRAAVIAAYTTIQDRLPDPEANLAVGKRLADLAMDDADERAADGDPAAYGAAIVRYQALLDELAGPEHAEVLYQLARAHDLAGDPAAARAALDRLIVEHPEHPLVVEGRFRRGEMAFSAGQWHAAEQDYAYVVDHGRDSAWWLNATYMSGWTRLRDGDPDGALDRFFAVLGEILEPTPEDGAADFAEPGSRVAPRDPAHAELLRDSLRATTLALGELDGAATLVAAMERLGRPAWQFHVYEALAGAYLQRERYLDSVAVWQTFVDAQPLDPRAPVAHRNAIEILLAADFPTEALAGKARFVEAYGIASEFWRVHDQAIHDGYLPALRGYLDDLARTEHATAQRNRAPEAFARAARWYEELIATFPDDPELPDYLFLLGELRTEAGDPTRAVAAYQRVMREFPEHPQAAEAGYAAVLGLGKLAASATTAADPVTTGGTDGATDPRATHIGTPRDDLARAHIESQLEFATRFPGDPRAPAVSAAAADGLFALGDYPAAVAAAQELLDSHPDLDPALRRTTLTVLGHGRFELGQDAAAESAYRALLDTPLDAAARTATVERLQASIYRQAEASEQAGAADAAVAQYLRVAEVAPGTELAAQGHYDAVAVLEGADRPADAARLLEAFRTRYPDHALAAAAPRRLAGLYEGIGDGRAAAAAWLDVASRDGDPEVQRQALYRAAELELADGDAAAATRHFTAYVERYPRPADLRLEALHHLDQLATQAGDAELRARWLQAKVDLAREMRAEGAGTTVLERANALAAAAQFALAERARQQFDAILLVDPLAESLERKQHALRVALDAFEAAAAYGVAEYVTASTWHIGDLYAGLAKSLMTSERPAGLSDAELEQYELLLEEQAFPFEEEAIAMHEINVGRAREGLWDPWVDRSFAALGRLVPARFDRPELLATSAPDPASDAGGTTRAALEAAVATDPGNCEAQTALALELRRAGEFAAAEQHYLACLAVRPDFGPAQLNLGILYELYLDRLDAALEAYRRYQGLVGEPDPRVSGWMQDIERRLEA